MSGGTVIRTMKSEPENFEGQPDFPFVDDSFVKKEKAKARELRDSAWWKRKKSSGLCYYCGSRFKSADLTMDHRVPISRGGRSVKENLVPCCKECNSKKKHLLPSEWTEYLDALLQKL